jgi:hypothetical protein
MKATVTMDTPRKYPYLGIYTDSGRIVLFTGPNAGVQVSDVAGAIGLNSNDWTEDDYSVFTGEVTLSN